MSSSFSCKLDSHRFSSVALFEMQRSIEVQSGAHSFRMILSAMGVRFLTSDTNPAHVNPDFLRFNEVIPAEWPVSRPVTLEAGFSRVGYENGLSVTATDNSVSFNQRHLEDPDVELAVPYVAGRYLDHPPEYLRFNSVGIGLAFIIGGPRSAELSPLLSALAVPYRDTVPNVFLRSMYRLRNMRVNITIGEGPSRPPGEASSLNIRGQVTYRVLKGRLPMTSSLFV